MRYAHVWSKEKNEEEKEELQRKKCHYFAFCSGMASGHCKQEILALRGSSQNLVHKSHSVHLEPCCLTSNRNKLLKLIVLLCFHLEIGTNNPHRAIMSQVSPYT